VAKFKGARLAYLVEEISSQHSIRQHHGCYWLLLPNLLYQEQRGTKWENLKSLQFGQKRNKSKSAAKEGAVVTDVSIIKKKPSTLHRKIGKLP
jgi:hypothetical protein